MKEKQNILLYFIALLVPLVSYGQQLGDLDLNSIDLDGIDPDAPAEEADASGALDKIKEEIGGLQDQITITVDAFQAATPNEQLKKLDETIAQLNSALAQTEETGTLGKAVKQTIKEHEATMKWLKKMSVEGTLRKRTRFKKLADDYEDTLADIYSAESSLYDSRKRMIETLKLIEEDKEYITAVYALKQGKKAVAGLKSVVDKMNTIADSFDQVVDRLAEDGPNGPGATGSN